MRSDAFALSTALLFLSTAVPAARSQTFLYEANGEETGLRLGASVSAAGDIDGDGFPDFAVGSLPWRTSHYGIIEVRSGRTGELLRMLQSEEPDDQFGIALSCVGDLDHDGVPDLVAGAPLAGHTAGHVLRGAVRAYSGADGSLLWIARSPLDGGGFSGFGIALDVLGDVDLDGTPDIVVGTCAGSGGDECVRVLSGEDGALLFSLCAGALGIPSDGRIDFGKSVAGPGDVDLDGYPDILVGAPDASVAGPSSGAAYLISGRDQSLLWSGAGPSALAKFGTVSRAGDTDLDGHADFLVGAPNDSTSGARAGSASLFSGHDRSLLQVFYGKPGENVGSFLFGGADANADGHADYGIGRSGLYEFAPERGAVVVYSGSDSSVIAWMTDWYAVRGVSSAAFVGDINGDGSEDFAVGAPTSDLNGSTSGSARVYLLGFPAAIQYCFPTFNSFGCGSSQLFQGVPSFSVGEPFVVTASYIMNRQMGFVVWGRAEASVPFGPGTLCVRPTFSGPVQNSGGSPSPGTDCSGVFVFRFTREYLAAHGIGPGEQVHCQFISREPHLDPPYNVMLSDAVVFTVVP